MTPPRSAALVQRNSRALDSSRAIRFIEEMTSGTISAESFERYVAIEEAFVRTAARVAGYCVWAAPDWAAVIEHAYTLESLLGKQQDFFLSQNLVEFPVTESLSAHVTESIEAFGYPVAIVSMFAAETLYSGWCRAALECRGVRRDPAVQDWIELHTTVEFTDQVRFLGKLVDRIPFEIPNVLLDAWFESMLDAENHFHNSVYLEVRSGR